MAKNGVFSRYRKFEEGSNRNEVNELLEHNERKGDVHVLAVDDSLVDRKVIERLLKITSCRVTAVDSGKKALQFLGLDEEDNPVGSNFNGLKVDMIITDYFMPGMTGYELMKKIKGSSTFREIPVVIMSSENVLARIDRCLQEGAEDFIVKPVKLSDVKRIKNYMFGESSRLQDMNNGSSSFNERNLQQSSNDDDSLSSSSLLRDSALMMHPSPPFNSSSSSSSPSSPRSFLSLPSSPTSSDSPTR